MSAARKKKASKAPAEIAVETVFDVHMTITVRGARREDDSEVEDFVTALVDLHMNDDYRTEGKPALRIVDATGIDAHYVCDAKDEGSFFDKDGAK
jgi:hypothetical protein